MKLTWWPTTNFRIRLIERLANLIHGNEELREWWHHKIELRVANEYGDHEIINYLKDVMS
jgi:hypothetical protein